MTEHEFVEACNKVVPKVLRYAKVATGSHDDAEDIIQETQLRAWRSIHKYDPTRSDFSTWFISIYRNTLMDHFMRQSESGSNIGLTLSIDDLLEHAETNSSHHDELLYTPRPDDRILLEEALIKLGGIHEEVVRACFIGGMTFQEISNERRLAPRKVRRILATALKRLKRIMLQEVHNMDGEETIAVQTTEQPATESSAAVDTTTPTTESESTPS